METINLTICSCHKYVEKAGWKQYRELDEVITQKVRRIFPKAKVIIPELHMPESQKEKKENLLRVIAKEKEKQVKVMIKLSKCTLCQREGGNYFESIFQIRSSSLDILEEAVTYLQHRVDAFKQRGMFINKVERLDDGFDLFMTNNKVSQNLARELQDRFGGEVKISPRLFSKNHQTSKNIYRMNILVQLPEFARGDIIVANDKVCKVDKLGKKIIMIDMQNNQRQIVDYAKLDYRILKKEPTFVSKTYPSFEVINPHDYQSSMVKNKPRHPFITGQSVNVVIHRGIYVVE
jgi:nonsense-mediated mRNA decay protein 3